jgi:hypothetical protein
VINIPPKGTRRSPTRARRRSVAAVTGANSLAVVDATINAMLLPRRRCWFAGVTDESNGRVHAATAASILGTLHP